MAKDFQTLKSEIRNELGVNTSNVITDAIAGDAVNEAQRNLVYEYPLLRDVRILNRTAFWLVAGQYEYDLTTLTPAVSSVIHLRYFEKDRKISRKLIAHEGGRRIWDEQVLPKIHANIGGGLPKTYLRRGTVLELSLPSGEQEAGIAVSGAAGVNNGSHTDITQVGAFAGLSLAGKYAHLTGTNVATGYYRIVSHTDDLLTLSGNAMSGAHNNDIAVHTGGVLWIEYARLPATMVQNGDTPALTHFDLILKEKAKAILLNTPAINKKAEARQAEEFAAYLLNQRLAGERDADRSYQNPYQGP